MTRALTFAILLAAACVETTTTSLDAGDTYDRLLTLYCEDAHRCEASADSSFDPALYLDSPQACLGTYRDALATRAEIDASIAAGRIAFDAETAELCLQLREGIDCLDYWHTTASEDPICGTLTGTVDEGGACAINLDCEGGGECAGGTCRALD